jgi:hypothetical protein
MRQVGLLEPDQEKLTFTSPVARRFALNWLYPNRPTVDPANLESLIRTVLASLSSSKLKSTVLPHTFPVEAIFQSVFLDSFISATQESFLVLPEFWEEFPKEGGPQKRIDGRIDFYINGELRWGVELLVNGDRLDDHRERFKEGGRYALLNVADYIVIDLRSGPVTRVRQLEKRATVFYDESFEFCHLLYGLDEKPDRIIFTP